MNKIATIPLPPLQSTAGRSSPLRACADPLLVGRTIEIRWNRLASAFASATSPAAPADPARYVEFALVVRATFSSPTHASVDAWVQQPGGRRMMLQQRAAACITAQRSSMLHVDLVPQAPVNGEFLLRFTLQQPEGELLFAATPLLAEAGFTGGSYDRPTITIASIDAETISA